MGPLAIYNSLPGAQGTQVVGTVGYSYPEVFFWSNPSGGDPIAEITISLKSAKN
jgi:hypothetical protein